MPAGTPGLATPACYVGNMKSHLATNHKRPPRRPVPELLLNLVLKGHRLYRANTGQIWCAVTVSDAHWYWPIRSHHFRDFLIAEFRERYEFTPSAAHIRHALRLMEANCQPLVPAPALRVGGDGVNDVVLDIADTPAGAVEITADGWTTHFQFDKYPFYRPQGVFDIDKPKGPGSLEPLRHLLRHLASPADWLRLLAWLLAALRPKGSYPILVLQGPPGSGKTLAARILSELIDPAATPLTPIPATESRLHSLAMHNHVLAFDHIGALPRHISDALCRLASGAGYIMKETSSSDPIQFHLERPILLSVTGDAMWTPPPELSARMLTVTFNPLPAEDQKPESEIWEEFRKAKPAILAALCDAIVMALRRRNQIEAIGTDAQVWAKAAAPALAATEGEMQTALLTSRFEHQPDPIIAQIEVLLNRQPNQEWTGTATELRAALPQSNRLAPPNKLAQRLTQSKTHLNDRGIELTFTHTKHSRQIEIKRSPHENQSSPGYTNGRPLLPTSPPSLPNPSPPNPR